MVVQRIVKPKDQGTRNETALVNKAKKHGLKAWRLAEGGGNDPGDVAIETAEGDVYVVECKHRQQLSVHNEFEKAAGKVKGVDHPFVVAGVALQWKRPFRVEGQERRVNKEVMVISVDEWLELISR